MKQFGLIGLPLGHSFSKKYFTNKFETEDIDAQFNLYELQNVSELLELREKPQLCGLNVTIPYKQQVIPLLDELDETAAEIGAVNVIKFIRSESGLHLKGYNSDAIGFETSIQPLLKSCHKKALILGTGGASKAIDYTLRKLGLVTTFVSRTAKEGMLTYNQLTEEVMTDHFVIVNASPVGTFPHVNECPDIAYRFLGADHLLFDAVYNPPLTMFLQKGREQGAQGLNGEGMLIGQAEAAWKIWNE